MTLWKVLDRFRSFFKGEEGVSAAQPIAEPVLKAESESQMADEHDRSTKLGDVIVEDLPLENRFKFVADFLDSMPGNSRVTEPGRIIRASSPSSVSSSRLCSLHETSIQTYQTLNQELETLKQQMDELSIFLAQSDLRREKLLAQALAKLQSISTAVHFDCATITIPNASESEPLTPPTKDMGVDPISLDTTTVSIADTLPKYHADDNGLRERNLYSSDTKNERISTSPSTSLSRDSLSNSHFPGTKSLISTTWLLPKLLKDSFEPHSVKRGLQDFIQVDPPLVQLKLDQLVIDVVDHRAQTVNTHGKKFWCPFMMGVAVAVHHAQFFYCHGRIDRRDIGVAVL